MDKLVEEHVVRHIDEVLSEQGKCGNTVAGYQLFGLDLPITGVPGILNVETVGSKRSTPRGHHHRQMQLTRCIRAVRADSTAAQFNEADWARLGAVDEVGYAALPLNFDEGEGTAGAAPDAAPQQEVQLPGAGEGGGGGP